MTETTRENSSGSDEKENKFLTFTLGDEEFGIGILKVREIIGMMSITPIPRTPEFIKGVINLRGKVIPVADLRLRFGMPATQATEHTCIIVVEVAATEKLIPLGVVVDAVCEVLNIKGEDIEDTLSLGDAGIDTKFIIGMAKTEGKVRILMDIDQAVGRQDWETLAA